MNFLSNLFSMNFVELPFLDELAVELLLLKASTRKLQLLDELDVDDNVKLDVGDVAETCYS